MMFKAIVTVGGFILLVWIQVPKMIKKKWWRDLTIYGIMVTFTFYYTLTYIMHWPFLDPVNSVTALMKSIFRVLGYEVPSD